MRGQIDYRDPIKRYGKYYDYEMTLYNRVSADHHANTIRNYGRWGFAVLIVPELMSNGKKRYHLYSRSLKPGIDEYRYVDGKPMGVE